MCLKRRGETMDVFFYDLPTARYLPQLYYWLGRAQEGVGLASDASRSFETFLALRPDAPRDPLVVDARRRVSSH